MGLRFYLRGLGIGIIVTALLMGYTSVSRKQTMTDEEIIARAAELGMVEEGKTLIKPGSEESNEGEDPKEPSVIQVEDITSDESEDEAEESTLDADSESSAEEGEEAAEPTEEIEKEAEASEDNTVNSGRMVGELSVSGTKDGNSTVEIKGEEEIKAEEKTETGTGTQSAETSKSAETSQVADTSKAAENEKTASTDNTGGKAANITVRGGSDSSAVARQLEQAGVVDSAEKFDEYLVGKRLDRYISTGSFRIPGGSSYAEIAKILTGR